MILSNSVEKTFEQSVGHANRVANRLLRSSLGAHTSEDVVSILIEKEIRKGKNLSEIQESLTGPGMYRRLTNVKNDIFRWETAAKRGHRKAVTPLDDVEPFLIATVEDPEDELIRKEDFAQMKDFLTQLLEKVKLSETQMQILELDQNGYSSKRIARKLGIKIDAVYARRSEALRKLVVAARHMSRNKK